MVSFIYSKFFEVQMEKILYRGKPDNFPWRIYETIEVFCKIAEPINGVNKGNYREWRYKDTIITYDLDIKDNVFVAVKGPNIKELEEYLINCKKEKIKEILGREAILMLEGCLN